MRPIIITCVFSQEVIGSLVTHVGGGQSHEVDAALSVLANLADAQPVAMAPFIVFLKVS